MSKKAIDFVVTWVNPNDKKWNEQKNSFLNKKGDDSAQRYREWDLFKYWFRCVEKNAKWVNKIYIITDNQTPEWLNTEHEKIVMVKHEEILPKRILPTYNSNAIEFGIGNIRNLGDNFVYFNDDIFLVKKVKEKDFFNKGKPCDNLGLNIIRGFENEICESVLKDMMIVNRLTPKKNLSLKTKLKMFNPKNGSILIKTLLLMPFNHFSALYDSHSAISFNKDFFNEARRLIRNEEKNTQSHRFREPDEVGIWTIRYLYLTRGLFSVRNNIGFSSYVEPTSENIKKISKEIQRPRHKIMCINDSEKCSEGFEDNKEKIINAFEKRFPNKSEFER